MIGKANMSDGLGGFYRWDASSIDDEDSKYLNVILSDITDYQAKGRWVRIFQRVKVYPHGVLVLNGGMKTFYAPGVTDANGQVTVNLTTDGTATGPAIFTDVWFNDSKATSSADSPSTAVSSYVRSLSSNLKVTSHGYFKANAVTIALGLVYAPLAAVPAGVPVQFRIEGP